MCAELIAPIPDRRSCEIIRIQASLFNEHQLGQDRRMPLDEMLESMILRFLKLVCSVKRVEPGVEEVLGPVVWRGGGERGVTEEEGGMSEIVHVLR
jgi:hypothetical protein